MSEPAQLFCDQLDFANVIILNKIDLIESDEDRRVCAILQRFNPSAELIETSWGKVDPRRLLGTGLSEWPRRSSIPGS